MVAISGRDLIVKKADTPIAGVRTKTLAIDTGVVDITNDDDSGFRKLLNRSGTRSLNLTVEGVWTDSILSAIAAGDDTAMTLDDITIEDGTDIISGDFRMASFERAGSHDGEVTYTTELQSTGPFTVAAAPA